MKHMECVRMKNVRLKHNYYTFIDHCNMLYYLHWKKEGENSELVR